MSHAPTRWSIKGAVFAASLAVVFAACSGSTASSAPSGGGNAALMSYPATGDAPCGVAPYTGNMKKITAIDALTVEFQLCSPDASFLPKVAFSAFGIQDSDYLTAHVPDGSILTPAERDRALQVQGMEQGQPDRLGSQPRLLGRQGQDPDPRAPLERRVGRPPGRPEVRHRRRHRQSRHPGHQDDPGRFDPEVLPARRAEHAVPRLQQHAEAVRRRAGPPGDRHGHRPRPDRQELLPGRLDRRRVLHSVRDRFRLHRRQDLDLRPRRGQDAPRRTPASRTATVSTSTSTSGQRSAATTRTRPSSPPRSPSSSRRTSASPRHRSWSSRAP